jgi:uncharacterized membrane protein YbhN (UPF0104 family)
VSAAQSEIRDPESETEQQGIAVPETRTSTPLRAWAPRVIGTLLFIALLVWLDLRGTLPIGDVLGTLARANVWLVALSIALYVPFVAVKAARWRSVSADMHMPTRWPDALAIYAIGLAAGTFTPGQAGDMLKAWYLQRIGYPLARGLGSSVLDRLFDVAGLAVLGLVGVAAYGQRFARQTPALVALAVVCVLAVAFFAWGTTRNWAIGIVARRLSKMGGGSAGRGIGAGRAWSLSPQTVTGAGVLTVLSFATSVFRVWLLAAALGIVLGPLEVSGFVGLTTAAALVPVTVGGVGTRDAVAALALSQLGHPAAEAVALSSLILLLNLSQAVIGWLVWLRYRPAPAVARH